MSQIATELTLTLSANIEEVARAKGIIMKLIKNRTEIIKMEALSFIWSCENVQAKQQLHLLAISKKDYFEFEVKNSRTATQKDTLHIMSPAKLKSQGSLNMENRF